MDFQMAEVTNFVTQFGKELPVLNPSQISRLPDFLLSDPDFIFVNVVDLESVKAVKSIPVQWTGEAGRAVGGGIVGAVIGSAIAHSFSEHGEDKQLATVIGGVTGALVGTVLGMAL